ncbi:MAG TPA: cellulase family glycosylhydrolase [bacterium]|uniref:Sugar-binding cellulase-like protein n=1 Tax=candidate division TA06 bacterium ADurb.Bin417 TaxID=1852828 RepID=A0A1V5MCD0_UNCT6|nr:MAG: Sugar-binding cellulase-like protein [candidate division TA06 bacterium ADurb.Bin417]HNQ34639.1 cellulase family glycosylhydrolase [bacterium]HNS48298.1 cellulase family glycosylhydrolase [bacterium]
MKRWSVEKAAAWYREQPWLVGCNFLPSNAVNQLEMWQAETYDPVTIDRELSWAEGLGFNTLRVYLHDLAWADDRTGCAERIDDFLERARRRGLRVIPVLFDDCHRPDPASGPQPQPLAGVHNSEWKQSPGQEIVRRFNEGTAPEGEKQRLSEYVRGVISRFAGDERVLMWDIYNEPGQGGNGDRSNELLELAWDWARQAGAVQPLTACLNGSRGEKNLVLNRSRSDVITFHGYDGGTLEKIIVEQKQENGGRPVICTEYMARELGTTFQHSLPIFRKHRVGCLNWGLVAGKSQTHFNWQTARKIEILRKTGRRLRPGEPIPEPPLWFHDIFRTDGTPFDPEEINYIRSVTKPELKTGR